MMCGQSSRRLLLPRRPLANMRVQRTRVLLPAVARRSPLTRRPLGAVMGRPLKLALLIATLGLARSVEACDCTGGNEPLDQLLKASTAVFWGRVVEIAPDSNPVATSDGSGFQRSRDRVHFDVGTSWKGIKSPDIWVREGNQPTACGFPFQQDAIYLVFAVDDIGGELAVWQCSGTRVWPNQGTLDQLDRATRPRRFRGHPRSLKKGDGA
jgi:hypothetical protein